MSEGMSVPDCMPANIGISIFKLIITGPIAVNAAPTPSNGATVAIALSFIIFSLSVSNSVLSAVSFIKSAVTSVVSPRFSSSKAFCFIATNNLCAPSAPKVSEARLRASVLSSVFFISSTRRVNSFRLFLPSLAQSLNDLFRPGMTLDTLIPALFNSPISSADSSVVNPAFWRTGP